jgi:hypothetical protein
MTKEGIGKMCSKICDSRPQMNVEIFKYLIVLLVGFESMLQLQKLAEHLHPIPPAANVLVHSPKSMQY